MSGGRARRHRRHARQDDDDRHDHRGARTPPGREPTGVVGGRVGTWGGNLRFGATGCSSSKPTSTIGRSSRSRRPSRWSRTSRPITSTSTPTSPTSTARSSKFVAPARTIVLCADDRARIALATPSTARGHPLRRCTRPMRGSSRVDVRTEGGGSLFEVEYDDEMLGEVELSVPGLHNVLNALPRSRAVSRSASTSTAMAPGLAAFRGVERRFQRLGTAGWRRRGRRLRASPDGDPRDARGSASARFRAGASSRRSSRTSTRARATSRASSARRLLRRTPCSSPTFIRRASSRFRA